MSVLVVLAQEAELLARIGIESDQIEERCVQVPVRAGLIGHDHVERLRQRCVGTQWSAKIFPVSAQAGLIGGDPYFAAMVAGDCQDHSVESRGGPQV
jgi:hypothetical protein